MRYQPINCEASVKIYNKKDCAYHAKLGWSKTEWHTHSKGQLIYAEYGIMRLYIKDQVLYIPSMHATWIPAHVAHSVATESVNIIFRTLYLDYTHLTDAFYSNVTVFYANTLLREMLLYTEKFNLDEQATTHEISFLEAVKQLLPQQSVNKISLHLPITEHPKLAAVTAYINDHFSEKLAIKEIVNIFGLGERTMSRLFQKELRMPFIQYVKVVRMVKAVEMLVQPGKNVSDVAYLVGYESLPTFSNIFNEIMGVRPILFLHK